MMNRMNDRNDNDMARTVRKAIDGYFRDLDGEKVSGVYDMVINCVEKPLIESVLTRVRGNQTHAAQMLGLNRNTLRKKMKAHGIKF
jgi:Fis family transcriptional regulator